MNAHSRKPFVVAAALFCGLVLAAKADSTVTYTTSVSGTFDFAPTPLALQQFNPNLGTLDSITISLSANSLTSLTVYNTSPSAYESPSFVWDDVQILLGTSTFDQAVDALNPNYGTWSLPNAWLDVSSPHFNVAGVTSGNSQGFSGDNTGVSGLPAVASGISSGTVFSDLQGTGTVNLDVASDSTVDSAIHGGATFTANETVTGGITAEVTYNYVASVPEPATVAMLGIGFCTLVVMRRRHAS
jgi:hypothetical protein